MSTDDPPMPVSTSITATLRGTGLYNQRAEPDELAVARIRFTDVEGEHLSLDFTPEVAMNLLTQLATFVRQVGVQGRF